MALKKVPKSVVLRTLKMKCSFNNQTHLNLFKQTKVQTGLKFWLFEGVQVSLLFLSSLKLVIYLGIIQHKVFCTFSQFQPHCVPNIHRDIVDVEMKIVCRFFFQLIFFYLLEVVFLGPKILLNSSKKIMISNFDDPIL